MTTTTTPPPTRPPTTAQRSPVVRVARWSATHPWRALALWVAFVAAAMAVMASVPTQSMGDEDNRIGESGRAEAMIDEAGLTGTPSELVLVTAPGGGTLDRTAADQVAADLQPAASAVDGVAGVAEPVWSDDGTAMLVGISLTDADLEDQETTAADLQDVTADVADAHPDLDVVQTGGTSIGSAIDERVGDDLAAGEARSLPITFALMVIAFGALIAAAIPVALAFSCVLTAMGLYALVSFLVPDSGTVASVILMIGMAVGVDYSLFYLKREREERRKGASTVDAIEIAAATSGRAIVVAGVAVIVAMSGLMLTRDTVFVGLAVGAMLVVAVAMLGSVTVLPALLAKLGRWVDRPRVPGLWRMNRRIGTGGISRRLIGPVLRHPRVSLAASVVVMAVLAAPALGMKLHEGTIETLPDDVPEVAAYQQVQRYLPTERSSIDVVARTADAGQTDDVRGALEMLGREAVDAGTASATGEVVVGDDGRTVLLELTAPEADGDSRNERAVTDLRDDLVPGALDGLGTTWAVGGNDARAVDHHADQRWTLPLVVAFVLGLTMLVMVAVFRSVTVALVTTALNLLSVGAAFGVMVLVFQNTWAESLLDFTSAGFLVDWVPLFCFVVLVGLSMDYHVFVMSRVREGLRRGMSTRLAVEYGVRQTASVVTSAAAVMISVFAVFATLSMLEMKQMGVGLSVAILLDATVVRLFLLPAALIVLDRRLGPLRRPDRREVGAAAEQ
ncbi:RND superfamily putative drug exporter [Mumia flava]|uniref:RND superfamily putative drug exporter n=1 Tax=Mumia flava TaxID=1348852 RepID=A0A2M9BGZ8_9ACTN|nr:MMPL family transporter [Mumia flava]PJJ57228.1 RND superfamily putative drug exporter [Mumia flava]